MTAWSREQLDLLARASELTISPLRQDKVRYARPTIIWSVVVGDQLVARAYTGRTARWYRTAMAQRIGRIHVAGHHFNVEFAPVERSSDADVDAAYRAKYGNSSYVGPMIADAARAASVRITLRAQGA
ncbi:hypothetical protein EV643_103437 [Kribbella sp. VKM Ac-2527]|uniref:DUF2255 family protein n=2 Tax=Kribbella caucasensis TaxID=2512215 RepID=A0A4R6KK47_9ACTN|nr:hypothetical protein EV643_103437 [Kribbella sp. VKM Ac-2527]